MARTIAMDSGCMAARTKPLSLVVVFRITQSSENLGIHFKD